MAPRRGTAQGTTRATTTKSATTKSAATTTTTTTATTDAAARTRGEPRVAVVTSDDEQCLLGAANRGWEACAASAPPPHYTSAIQLHRLLSPPSLRMDVTEAVICLSAPGLRLQRSSQGEWPLTSAKIRRRFGSYLLAHCNRKSNSSSSISPVLQHPLALAIEQTGVPGISSGHRLQVTASLSSLASLRRLPHEACLSKAFFAADGRILALASPANSPVTDHPSAGPPHSSNALSVLSFSGRGTI